jgi:hypothetical protein
MVMKTFARRLLLLNRWLLKCLPIVDVLGRAARAWPRGPKSGDSYVASPKLALRLLYRDIKHVVTRTAC